MKKDDVLSQLCSIGEEDDTRENHRTEKQEEKGTLGQSVTVAQVVCMASCQVGIRGLGFLAKGVSDKAV